MCREREREGGKRRERKLVCNGGEAPASASTLLRGVRTTSRVLRIRPRFREMQALVDPERPRSLPRSSQRSHYQNPNLLIPNNRFLRVERFCFFECLFLCVFQRQMQRTLIKSPINSSPLQSPPEVMRFLIRILG